MLLTRTVFMILMAGHTHTLSLSRSGVSVLMVIKHTTIPNVQLLGRTPEGRWRDICENTEASLVPVRRHCIVASNNVPVI